VGFRRNLPLRRGAKDMALAYRTVAKYIKREISLRDKLKEREK
jgi:hypothetical protein